VNPYITASFGGFFTKIFSPPFPAFYKKFGFMAERYG